MTSRRRWLGIAFACLAVSVGLAVPAAGAAGDSASACQIQSADGFFNGQTGIVVNGKCVALNQAPDTTGSLIPVRTIDCGQDPTLPPGVAWNVVQCGAQVNACPPLRVGGNIVYVDTFLVQEQQPTGGWVDLDFWCPGNADPIPRTAALRELALRLVPHVDIGTQPGLALVNTQTVLWADTAATRDLGAVTVVNVKVYLRLHFRQAAWDFGDGTSATSDQPGAQYPDHGACATKTCDGYFGHVYTSTGDHQLSLAVTWTADFSLDGTNFAPVATGPLPSPTQTQAIHLKEARGVLVPNPGD